MAGAWGEAWGQAWGDAWGEVSGDTPPDEPTLEEAGAVLQLMAEEQKALDRRNAQVLVVLAC